MWFCENVMLCIESNTTACRGLVDSVRIFIIIIAVLYCDSYFKLACVIL